eukprot:1134189-Pelagomonas_calceolata.AAC.4
MQAWHEEAGPQAQGRDPGQGCTGPPLSSGRYPGQGGKGKYDCALLDMLLDPHMKIVRSISCWTSRIGREAEEANERLDADEQAGKHPLEHCVMKS